MFELTITWSRNFGETQNKNIECATKDNQNSIKIFSIKDKPQILHFDQRKYVFYFPQLKSIIKT